MKKEVHPSLARLKRSINGRRAKVDGDFFEKVVGNWLESLGFLIELERPERLLIKDRKTGGKKWMNKSVDIFGLFDIAAMAPNGFTLWVQCKKSHRAAAAARKKIDLYKNGRWPKGAWTVVITNGKKPGSIYIFERSNIDSWVRYEVPLRSEAWPTTWYTRTGRTGGCVSSVGVIEPAMRLLKNKDQEPTTKGKLF